MTFTLRSSLHVCRATTIYFVGILVTLLTSTCPALAQDVTLLGGDLSTDLLGHNALQVGAPNISSSERLAKQLSGFAVFHRAVSKNQGLGPRFNNNSCGGCHVENGKGPIRFNSLIHGGSTALVKVRLSGTNANGTPKNVPNVGLQLLDQSLNGDTFYKIQLYWQQSRGSYPDRSTYTLRNPKVTFSIPRVPNKYVHSSLRMSPQLIGLGLLESIPESSILVHADEQDRNKDGISGKPNYVLDINTKRKRLGRFGFKASNPTVEQQSAAAAFHDMGLTNPLFQRRNTANEISASEFESLILYQQLPGVPKARNQDDTTVKRGKFLFQKIGCAKCHIMTFETGDSTEPELVHQIIHPFSDLLLHDMGKDLSDGYAEFKANGNEWRTTPLWGLGFAESVSGEKALYLHDGRARTIEEAILWHGGEGTRSKAAFKGLSKFNREAVLRFLQSL